MNWKTFFICGLTGWCMEILFTSLGGLLRGDLLLNGHTSIWMFPIYGLAAVIGPLSVRLRHWPVLLRGCFYGAGIMLVEFISGSFLRLFSLCPWDYSRTPYNISGLVRLDYFPVWFTAGLIFEYILSQKRSTSSRDVPLFLTLLLSDAGSDWYIFPRNTCSGTLLFPHLPE